MSVFRLGADQLQSSMTRTPHRQLASLPQYQAGEDPWWPEIKHKRQDVMDTSTPSTAEILIPYVLEWKVGFEYTPSLFNTWSRLDEYSDHRRSRFQIRSIYLRSNIHFKSEFFKQIFTVYETGLIDRSDMCSCLKVYDATAVCSGRSFKL